MLFIERLTNYFDRLFYKYVLDNCMLVLCTFFVTILRINCHGSKAELAVLASSNSQQNMLFCSQGEGGVKILIVQFKLIARKRLII